MSKFKIEGKDISDLFNKSEEALREYAQKTNIQGISENFFLEIISPLVTDSYTHLTLPTICSV